MLVSLLPQQALPQSLTPSLASYSPLQCYAETIASAQAASVAVTARAAPGRGTAREIVWLSVLVRAIALAQVCEHAPALALAQVSERALVLALAPAPAQVSGHAPAPAPALATGAVAALPALVRLTL
jgi:hypothetical protein